MFAVNNLSSFNSSKIKLEKQLVQIVYDFKKKGKSVGLCVGSYDLLHPGHVKHLESAKDLCDVLVVAVTSDNFVRKRKGSNRPVICEQLRAYSISQLQSVDYVLISPYEKATDLIYSLKPSFYIKGSDYKNKHTPGITAERTAISEVGGVMKYTFDEKFSSTELIQKISKKTDKPVMIISAGMASAGQSSLLKAFAKKNNFMYLDKDAIDESFLTMIKNGKISDQDVTRDSLKYRSDVQYQTYLAMFQIAESNLSFGFNVVLDGYFSDKLQIPFIKDALSDISKNFHVIKVYFTCSKETLFNRMKQRNLKRDENKLKNFEKYYYNHRDDDLSEFDVVFNTDGDLFVNVDSLSHEMMNKIYGE